MNKPSLARAVSELGVEAIPDDRNLLHTECDILAPVRWVACWISPRSTA